MKLILRKGQLSVARGALNALMYVCRLAYVENESANKLYSLIMDIGALLDSAEER